MLQWFRMYARSLAAPVLVAFLALGAPAHGSECHEDACAAAIRHDPAGHGLQAASAASGGAIHCVLCHWTRSTRPSPEGVHDVTPAPPAGALVSVDTSGSVTAAWTPQPPLRSPPPLQF